MGINRDGLSPCFDPKKISVHPFSTTLCNQQPDSSGGIGSMRVFESHPLEVNPHLFGVAPTT
jgi:hypothetical protein